MISGTIVRLTLHFPSTRGNKSIQKVSLQMTLMTYTRLDIGMKQNVLPTVFWTTP